MHPSGTHPPIWFLVFPLVLWCRSFRLKLFFLGNPSSILTMWPAHPNLLILMSSTMFGSLWVVQCASKSNASRTPFWRYTNRLLSNTTVKCFDRSWPSSGHQRDILKYGNMQYVCIHRVISLCGIPQVYSLHYNMQLWNLFVYKLTVVKLL